MLHSKSNDSLPGQETRDLRLLARLNDQLQAALRLYMEVRERIPDPGVLNDDWIVAIDRSRSIESASLNAAKIRNRGSMQWRYAPMKTLLSDDDIAWVLESDCTEQWLILRRQRRMVFRIFLNELRDEIEADRKRPRHHIDLGRAHRAYWYERGLLLGLECCVLLHWTRIIPATRAASALMRALQKSVDWCPEPQSA